jgi:hypothetical protein
MDVTRVMTRLFSIGIVASAAARPVGEADAAFVARTISASPMSKDSRVQARLTDCTLIIDQTIPTEKKRTVLPLPRLDEHSFEVSEDHEWGWFVEVHTHHHQRDIKTATAKWRASLAIYYIHVSDEKNAEKIRDALVRIVRSCRRKQHRPNHALEPTAGRCDKLLVIL